MSVAIAIFLDIRRIKENNKYPVKLRVNFRRVTKNYQTVFDLTKEDYDKFSAPRISAEWFL
jgi:integrase/recombinase XerD